MNRPSISEFDGWKNSPVGQWYFRVYLKEYADLAAGENGRGVGRVEETVDAEFMTFVRNAGVIQGVESVINGITEEDLLLDPFVEERDEIESGKSSITGENGLGLD